MMMLPAFMLGASVVASPTGEFRIRARLPAKADRSKAAALGAGFLEGGRGGWRHLAVNSAQLAALQDAGVAVEFLPAPPPEGPDGYPTHEEMADALQALAEAHPDTARLVQLGVSEEGRAIWALRISATASPDLQWRILGDHHGDEPSSGVLALAVAEHLLRLHGTDSDITRLLDTDAVWIAPMVNPDGIARGSRYNANAVDINRNFGHAWSAAAYRAGEAPFSEPETRAVRAHGAWTGLGAGLSMHSGETNLGWVWNHDAMPAPDASLLEDMATAYLDACTTPGFWVTNGADWYPTTGDTNDWSYGRHGVLDFTLEVTLDKAPPAELLPQMIEDHIPAVVTFLSWPHRATGTVQDAETGLPVPAVVQIDGVPLSTGPDGRFGRPISPAGRTAVVAAPGFRSQSVDLEPGVPATVLLERDGLDPVRPLPVVLSRTGPGEFDLPFHADAVRLHRTGELPVAAIPTAGGWRIDPALLAPGPWTLVVDGMAAPNALFIGEVDDRVELNAVEVSDDRVSLLGRGFGHGTRAWAFAGALRSPIPLIILTTT
ncbi:MAG: M14 family zinc carboxypeptidase, partial [Myxococcota bacterium]|nr:M14 family zinc carboxypeptidase [Myxococcota bacterium]